MTQPVRKYLIVKSFDGSQKENMEANFRWRKILEADFDLKKNMPEQITEPLLIKEDEPVRAGRYNREFLDLMLNGPDKNFVQRLTNLIPVIKKKKMKATLTDNHEIRMVEI